MKKKEQLPIYKREFCLHKEGTRTFLPTIVQAHQPITDEDLRVTASWTRKECSWIYGGKWIIYFGMTGEKMAMRRAELAKAIM